LVRVARVAALDRHPDGLGETVEMMSGDGTAAMAVTCDLTDEATVQRAVRKVVAEFRGLDGVVANAGAGGRCAMTDDGSAMRVDETLCEGTALCAQIAPDLFELDGPPPTRVVATSLTE
jgi:NAD(P)-dependent dehydrogenase (short-subunit alcohol dehydrogenase family)